MNTGKMNVNELTKLSVADLRRIKNRNLLFFNILISLNLVVFYKSIHNENWVMLFISIGFFVACLALYDNYRLSRNLIEYLDK